MMHKYTKSISQKCAKMRISFRKNAQKCELNFAKLRIDTLLQKILNNQEPLNGNYRIAKLNESSNFVSSLIPK